MPTSPQPNRLSRRDLLSKVTAPLGSAPLPPITSLEHHILARATFGRNEDTLKELEKYGVDGWLDYQMNHDAIDDTECELIVRNSAERNATHGASTRLMARALFSRRQLACRMTHFLNNHFSTYRRSTAAVSETQEDEAFFKSCFTNFRTVLRISATSPAMIDFLDSASNTAASPNENYARELMELHTLGVGNYTEPDVIEAARVFTGWFRRNVRDPVTNQTIRSHFDFRGSRHDPGPKSLSHGWSTLGISGNRGYLEGFDLLDTLAADPRTATLFTRKLCQYFVADQPSASLLAEVRAAFINSGGEFKPTLRAIFLHPDFTQLSSAREKVFDGFEFVANVTRRLEIFDCDIDNLTDQLVELGGRPHDYPEPTGYPEIGPYWQGSSNLLPRWKFIDDLVQGNISGVDVPWRDLFNGPLPVTGHDWASDLTERLLDRDIPVATLTALGQFMDSRLNGVPPNPALLMLLPHVRDLTSIILRLPEAQLC